MLRRRPCGRSSRPARLGLRPPSAKRERGSARLLGALCVRGVREGGSAALRSVQRSISCWAWRLETIIQGAAPNNLQHKDHRFTPDKTLVHFYGSDSFGSGSSVSRANWLVAFASMSHSCFTWRGFLRDSRSSHRLSVERPSALFPSPSLKVACVNAKPTGRRNRWHKVNGARTSGSLLEGVDATVEASKINDATVHSW